jgi:hypothetical protein
VRAVLAGNVDEQSVFIAHVKLAFLKSGISQLPLAAFDQDHDVAGLEKDVFARGVGFEIALEQFLANRMHEKWIVPARAAL